MSFIALDIETTGLDPKVDRVLTVALVGDGWAEIHADQDEYALLLNLDSADTLSYPLDAIIVTWNGGGFDLPFLAERFAQHGIKSHLNISETGETSKYGTPVYDGQWWDLPHWDIAPEYKDVAERLGVKWSLKPVAKAVLGVEPIEFDMSQGSEYLHPAIRSAYCLSDAGITLALAEVEQEHCNVDIETFCKLFRGVR